MRILDNPVIILLIIIILSGLREGGRARTFTSFDIDEIGAPKTTDTRPHPMGVSVSVIS